MVFCVYVCHSNRVLGTYGTITKDLTSCHQSPRGEEKEDRAEKVLEKIMAESFPNLSKSINRFKKLNISQAG